MWKFKTLKFKEYFKIAELQKSFTTYNWAIMYMMDLKKKRHLEYNITKECENLIFGDDLKIWRFFKMKH